MRSKADIRPRKKILIVDDVPSGRMLLAAVLSKHGYRTSEASSSDVISELLSTQNHHAVILNVSMLATSIEYVSNVRSVMNPDAHLFIASANDQYDIEQAAIRAGANHFLRVPFKFEDILARLEAIDSLAKLDGPEA